MFERRKRRSTAARPPCALTALPVDALFVVLDLCDVGSHVGLRASCRLLSTRTEAHAQRQARAWGWRRGDGLHSWVERLGRRVCVFEASTFRRLDDDAVAQNNAAFCDAPEEERDAQPSTPPPTFSEHGSKVRIRRPGRYVVCATPEPSLGDYAGAFDDDAEKKRRREEDEEEGQTPKRRRTLSFKVRVGDGSSTAALRSSVYVGVATRAFSEKVSGDDKAPQAVRSADAWLVDLRRGRFVHAYPEYDRRVAATRGAARARALASTDDVARSGDVVGVRVVDDTAFFYKNGRRLAFGCGGGVFTAEHAQGHGTVVALGDHLGWGRPLPSSGVDLVPVVEVHAKPSPDPTECCDLELEIANWSPKDDANGEDDEPFDDDDERRSDATSNSRDEPRRRLLAFAGRRRRRLRLLLLRFVVPSSLRRFARCSVAPRVPAAVGLLQLSLDLASFAVDPGDLRRVRAFCDAFALSVAVSTVWKTHFYDHRRPRRSRRGLRLLLKIHLLKCFLLALVAARALEPRLARVFRGAGDACALPQAVTAASAWLLTEVFVECLLQLFAFLEVCRRHLLSSLGAFRVLLGDDNVAPRQPCAESSGTTAAPALPQAPPLAPTHGAAPPPQEAHRHRSRATLLRPQGLAAALRSFPVGHDTPVATARAVVRFFLMIFIVPGSASLVFALAKDRFLTDCGALALGENHLVDDLLRVLVYPSVALWWAFALFVKFGFLVFGLHALCGFEDYYAPGWLLG